MNEPSRRPSLPSSIGLVANTPARDFGAYSVSFDGKALGVGETIEAGPGVKLTRRC